MKILELPRMFDWVQMNYVVDERVARMLETEGLWCPSEPPFDILMEDEVFDRFVSSHGFEIVEYPLKTLVSKCLFKKSFHDKPLSAMSQDIYIFFYSVEEMEAVKKEEDEFFYID